jgi:hypothetical protein
VCPSVDVLWQPVGQQTCKRACSRTGQRQAASNFPSFRSSGSRVHRALDAHASRCEQAETLVGEWRLRKLESQTGRRQGASDGNRGVVESALAAPIYAFPTPGPFADE